MRYPSYHPILTDFDTSVILPFYRKLEDFKRILPTNAPYFQRNGIEVIIVMDEPTERQGLIDFIKGYPLINWVVIVNDRAHAWRNPCKALNVGIKAASRRYVMVCSPESEFHTDAIFRLRYMAEHYDPCFAIGKVAFGRYGADEESELARALPYGSLLVRKDYLEQVGGYSEFFDQWGGEDNNIRAKLERKGIKKVYVPDAVLIHREEEQNGYGTRAEKSKELPEHVARRSYYPRQEDFTNAGWGSDFNSILFHYDKDRHSAELCKLYLRSFKEYEICRGNAFSQKYRVVALIQTHNEKQHMPEVLLHLDGICDGVILLDDESTDGTYELAESAKLLLKVQKHRKGFHDLENRNLLLDIGSFINADWLFFIDADERFDSRFNDFSEIINHEQNPVVSFWLVNTWDSPEFYRTDITDSARYSKDGLLSRPRMFRNDKGRIQLILKDRRKLHFSPVPYNIEPKPANLLLIHYGLQDREKREKKCIFYKLEDDYEKRNLDEYYSYMLDKNPSLASVENITLNTASIHN